MFHFPSKIHPSTYLLALGHLSVDWAQSALPALLPYFIAHYGLSYQEAATLVFANISVASILQPIFGYYSDKVSRPWFIPIGPIACGLCISLLGFTTSYEMTFFAAMLGGLGSAIYHPEAALLVNRISNAGNKGQSLSTFAVGGNAGFAIGPVVAGLCAYTLGIQSLIIFGVVNVVLALILASRLPALLRQAHQNAKAAEVKSKATGGLKNDWHAFGKLSFAILARSLGFTLSNTFIPIFWITILHATPPQSANALSFLFFFGVFVTYCGGIIADKFGFVKILRLAFLGMIPSTAILFNTTNYYLAMVMLVPLAISIFLQYSPIIFLGQKYLAKNAGFASGVTMGLSTTLGGLLAPGIGWVADTYGLVFALQILWIAGCIGAAASFSLELDKKNA